MRTYVHVYRYVPFEVTGKAYLMLLQQDYQRFIPPLPPKSPLAKFRPSFLDQRRRLLQHWLSSVLLHPDIGGCQILREWVMD